MKTMIIVYCIKGYLLLSGPQGMAANIIATPSPPFLLHLKNSHLLSSEIKKKKSPFSWRSIHMSRLLALSLNTHSFKHCSLSHGESPEMWQGHIRQREVDRQGWQDKNHAPQF